MGTAERTQLPTDGKPQGLLKYEWLDDDNPTFKATPPKSGLNLVSSQENTAVNHHPSDHPLHFKALNVSVCAGYLLGRLWMLRLLRCASRNLGISLSAHDW